MSHDRGWRAACDKTEWILDFHFGSREVARGVTAMVVGSGALLGRFLSDGEDEIIKIVIQLEIIAVIPTPITEVFDYHRRTGMPP